LSDTILNPPNNTLDAGHVHHLYWAEVREVMHVEGILSRYVTGSDCCQDQCCGFSEVKVVARRQLNNEKILELSKESAKLKFRPAVELSGMFVDELLVLEQDELL
jgi:hypothetical protein